MLIASSPSSHATTLYTCKFLTPLGDMVAIADNNSVYLIEFIDRKNLEKNIQKLLSRVQGTLVEKKNSILSSLEQEIAAYFEGTLTTFSTPIAPFGTPFYQNVWNELAAIPFGNTHSYATLAHKIGKPTAYRAVAQANSKNEFALIVPCHRVTYQNGKLGGYAAGVDKKQWLLAHEKAILAKNKNV